MSTFVIHSASVKSLALLFCLALPFAGAQAEERNMQQFGDYQVHYSVFNTSFLSPDIAGHYGIVRSGDRALMNVAVLKKQSDGSLENVRADISGTRFDLIRRDPLAFQEVQEQHAIYYLSDFPVQHRTMIYYTLEILPEGSNRSLEVQFRKMLYRDE